MSFEGEFASYEPLRRVLDSNKIQALQDRMRVRKAEASEHENIFDLLTYKKDLSQSTIQPDLILAIDGSHMAAKAVNGFPGAEFGYITIASVLIDLKLIKQLAVDDFIDPKKFRETEKASTIESVFPGCNIILDSEKCAKSSLRRALFEELKSNVIFSEGETLLDTYEHLFRIKQEKFSERNLPHSPIDGVDEEMTYGYGEYKDVITGLQFERLASASGPTLGEIRRPSDGKVPQKVVFIACAGSRDPVAVRHS